MIEERLGAFHGNDAQREATLKRMFLEAGCPADQLTEFPVKKSKQPNLECVLPGSTEDIVIVGAHFDHADEGSGVIDNWSGASMLPSLVQGLAGTPHRKTFWFVAFTGEEEGLLGSDAFSNALSPETLSHVTAMINLDTLGLGPTLVWVSQSDPKLVALLNGLAHLQKLPLKGMNVNGMGISDEESFIAHGVCTITLHSLTPETRGVLHSSRDNLGSVQRADYFDSYRLTVTFVAALGSMDVPKHTCDIEPLALDGSKRRLVPLRRMGSRAVARPAPQ